MKRVKGAVWKYPNSKERGMTWAAELSEPWERIGDRKLIRSMVGKNRRDLRRVAMSIWSRMDRVEGIVEYLRKLAEPKFGYGPPPVLVTCESCGCAVVKGHEVAGKAEIRESKFSAVVKGHEVAGKAEIRESKLSIADKWAIAWETFIAQGLQTSTSLSGPYLHTPVYCKRCAGKKAKPKRSHKRKK